ncbi:hypothetical protein EV702DRAFT_1044795 [Suillus placidus]|uniref:DUF8190 domain-containing protein n=1 Tax=Suillus placidus TaxID=48579 RepID=A0A9P6ZWI9_9AGAM|nr:hypothetical protein EV702DRAFT_1044795 [Suillus placidus]
MVMRGQDNTGPTWEQTPICNMTLSAFERHFLNFVLVVSGVIGLDAFLPNTISDHTFTGTLDFGLQTKQFRPKFGKSWFDPTGSMMAIGNGGACELWLIELGNFVLLPLNHSALAKGTLVVDRGNENLHNYIAIPDAQVIDMQTVRKYLMEMNLPLIQQNNEFTMWYFISSLVLDMKPPSLAWDLHPSNVREIAASNPHFTFTPMKDNTLTSYLMLPCTKKFTQKWNLFINSALSVIQCIKEGWGLPLEDVILCFFEHGIHFKVMFNTAYISIPCPISVFESNWCPYGWQTAKYEYMDYEHQ